MALSSNAKLELAESLLVDFQQFVNEDYDLELSELLANAANAFVAKTFEGKIDPELEAELAGIIIADAFVQVWLIEANFIDNTGIKTAKASRPAVH